MQEKIKSHNQYALIIIIQDKTKRSKKMQQKCKKKEVHASLSLPTISSLIFSLGKSGKKYIKNEETNNNNKW